MSIINIRESLNRLDLQTDNKYDLRNTYDCSKISDDKKKKLAEALNKNASAKTISRILDESYGGYDYYLIEFFVDGRRYEEEYTDTSAKEALERFKEDYSDDDYKIREIYKLTGEGYVGLGYPFIHKNESLVEAINAKDAMIAQEFNYTMSYGDQSSDVNAAVIIIPGGLKIDGNPADLVVYAEDENGEVINFKSVEEANDWIDKYKDNIEFHVEQGNELHATPLTYYDSIEESLSEDLTEDKKVGSNELSNRRGFPRDSWELVKITDGVVSYKGTNECDIYSRELDNNYSLYDYYQGEVIFDDYGINNPQLIQDVFPDVGTKVKLAIYKVPEDDPDHHWTGDYFVDYIDETNESLKEQINLPGYAVKYVTSYAGNGVNNSETEWFRTEEERDKRVKELEDKNYIDIKTWKMDNFYHTPPKNESLNEAYKFIDSKKLEKNYPYYFHYESNNPFAAEDFWRYAESLNCLKVEGKYKNSQNVIFFVCPSEESYNKLLQFNKKNSLLPWIGELSNNYSNDYDQLVVKFFGKPKKLENLTESTDIYEIDFDEFEEDDFDDDTVEEGTNFIEDGTEWVWVERIAGPIHLDFDNWAVWSAREYVDPRDFMTIKQDEKGYDFDAEGFKKKAMAAPVNYFVVDEDTGFIDWGPVETSTEAQDFLNGKVEDYENDEEYEEVEIEEESLTESINQNDVFKFLDEIKDTVSSFKNRVQEVSEYFDISEDEAEDFVYDWEQENSLTESKAIKNDDDFEITLHYDDIGNGKEYDYKLGYDEVVDYLREIAWANGDGPEDVNEDEYLEWVMDNFDELADKYELNVLNYFESEASQYEYDHRNDEP